MNIQSFLLFVAWLLFGVFNLYANMKASDKTSKLVTLILLYTAMICMVIILTISLETFAAN